MEELIRKGEAARLLGISASRVSQLIRCGQLKEVDGTGMLCRVEVEQWVKARALAANAVDEELPPIAISRQRLEAARAAIAQHDLEARRGQFIDKEVVAKEAFEAGRRVRQALEALPYRLASTLAGELGLDAAEAGSVVQELMAAEIRLALEELTQEPKGA